MDRLQYILQEIRDICFCVFMEQDILHYHLLHWQSSLRVNLLLQLLTLEVMVITTVKMKLICQKRS